VDPRRVIELIVRPPTLFPNADCLGEHLVDGPLQRRDTRLRIDPLQQFSNKGRMRFDEAEKSVRVLLVVTAADPQAKLLVGHRNHPAPIFSDRLLRFKALFSEIVPEELSQPLSPQAGVDLFLLAVVRGKSVGTKLDMRLHGNPYSVYLYGLGFNTL
jgi:hypothetical protein